MVLKKGRGKQVNTEAHRIDMKLHNVWEWVQLQPLICQLLKQQVYLSDEIAVRGRERESGW